MCASNQRWTNPHKRIRKLRQSGSANSHPERSADYNYCPGSPMTELELDNVKHYLYISILSTSHGDEQILQAAHFIFTFTPQFKRNDSIIGFYGLEDPFFSPS
ncbi:hypothetical protein G5I_08640 [Acromyrmex echinatior]|uniref:Uncharacterized protein n=1 Tax=Acromyrmex echinatior TaxID=103372 RepID=F4WS30_ACREC|nr:hypothetical protein G5I_08640 [Acromyrmex echinatior]